MLLVWIRRHFFALILTLILSFICFRNYTPGTYLAGWDNLMPELNIWLNLKRSLFAVWQEYQGLGLVGGMGHATDLIRQLIVLPFTLVLPINFIRYLWHFAMLFLGTFGIYFGLQKTLKFTKIVAFLSALFYLLNFGTIQYFWAPLETFSTFWGFFPWLIFALWNYLDNKLSLQKLLLINLLAIPSFYVQTLFIVYILCVLIILFSHFILNFKVYRLRFTVYAKILLLIFSINSFWLLPQLYFVKNNLQNTTASIGNFMSSDESFARNQYRGYPADFLLLRNYYIDFPDTEGNFMTPWVSHFANHYILICGYLLSSIFVIGFIYLLSRPSRLNHQKLSLLFLTLLSAIALLSAITPFKEINSLFRLFGLINQIFRAPFTKFIVPTAFCFSLLTAYGLKVLFNFISLIKYPKNIFIPVLFTIYCFLITIFAYPVFTGNFISPKMRQTIPMQYFDMFGYLKTKSPSARIANLPSGSYWGWTNYLWGYRGSGFIWYALPQPILDRAFDTWNLNNEQYYWELDTALQKRDPQLLSRVFQKYSIEYVLFDNNVYFPDEFVYSKLSLSTKELFDQVPGLTKDKQFGQISLYKTGVVTSPYLLENPTPTSTTKFFYEDSIYWQHHDYFYSPNSTDYPYLNLFTSRLQNEYKYQNDFQKYQLDNSTNLVKNISSSNTLLTNTHSYQLLAYNFPLASLGKSYLVKVEYQYFTGLPLTVSINSDNRQQKYVSSKLEAKNGLNTVWFVIPAHEIADFNQGITVLFNNNSLSYFPTRNKIIDVNFYSIPFYDLIQQSSDPSLNVSTRVDQQFRNYLFFYQVNISSSFNSYLVLPQSFSSGWLAFYFSGLRPVFLKNHVLVNNWSNGWTIPNTDYGLPITVYVFFWPQLLELLGFGLLLGTIIFVFKNKK